ncbi:MAG: Lon protease 2 [Actinomycetota bacterium]|jgi:Lon protease-like protein
MFPLGSPLLPGAVLPLHVFELRYRMMIDDVLHSPDQEFGVVLIERGHEVGGGDTRATVGTMARVLRHDEFEDGRRAVVAIGVRRIRVDEWLADDPYPVAMVGDWAESSADATSIDTREVESRLDVVVERFVSLLRRIDERAPLLEPRATSESVDEYVYRVGSTLPIGPVDRQRLLEAVDSDERLRRAVEAMEDLEAAVRFRLGPSGLDQ